MKVAVYYRVSTQGQGEDHRLGLPTQRDTVARFCTTNCHLIVRQFEDIGYSGATAERPALAQMLEAARAGEFEAVVVYAWDRIARDTMLDGYLRYQLKAHGVTVLSATQTNGVDPLSDLTQNILAAVAQFERHLIAQRLSAARKLKRSRGGYAGGRPPIGTRAERGQLLPNPVEAVAVEAAIRARREGKPYRAIAEELNARAIPTRYGGKWHASTVQSILARASASC